VNSLLATGQALNLNTASSSDFWGLGKEGLITVVIISVLLIATVAWLIHGTKSRD